MLESYAEFLAKQGGEDACAAYFYRCRWPDGYRCPLCGHREAYTIATRRRPLYECARCRYQASVTSGTCMEGTRTALSKWLFAMERMSDPFSGINATQLTKQIGVTYKTAHAMMNKIRASLLLEHDGADRLSGRVEAGLAIYGPSLPSLFELNEQEQPVAAAMEIDGAGQPVRWSWMVLEREQMHGGSLTKEARQLVKRECFASDPASQANDVHRSWLLTVRHCRTMVPILRAEFKRIRTTYRGIGASSLPKYLAEAIFRWNARQNGGDCVRLMVQACQAFRHVQRSPAALRSAC
ncbi:transposase [Cohnella fermenti]|uniref:Transposase n=1 Tax=Cohnella fermenti TaxID=2565925 RepID=A0A4S4BNP8_9BACL|nr:transposase [Cohnella fermenti]THF75929.1 transposase [Cohnella fermenti]